MEFYIKVDNDLYLSRVTSNLFWNDRDLNIKIDDKIIYQEVDWQTGEFTGRECEKVVEYISYTSTPPLVRFNKEYREII